MKTIRKSTIVLINGYKKDGSHVIRPARLEEDFSPRDTKVVFYDFYREGIRSLLKDNIISVIPAK